MARITLLIALLSAFPPLSTDMYLAAIPLLRDQWNQPLVVVNLTLIGFFLAYCLFMLIYGPVSDRFGRKKPLLFGVGIYVAASIVCAFANGIYTLIAARVFQASGAASASALSLAMCKDLFEVKKRAQVLAQIAVIISLAPMLAPVIGGWVIHFFSWRWVFVAQGFMGFIAWVGVYLMEEPMKRFQKTSPVQAVLVYFRLFGNRRFVSLLLAFSILALPFFGFIAGSSDIYMSDFGLDERAFGYFFGFNALALMFGAMLFTRLSVRFDSPIIMMVSFAGIMAAGWIMAVLPHHSPFSLALPMWCLSLFSGMSRPPSNNLILEQVDTDTGAASALIIVSYMTIGALGMFLISLDWADKIMVLGVMGGIVGTATFAFWLRYRGRFVIDTGR